MPTKYTYQKFLVATKFHIDKLLKEHDEAPASRKDGLAQKIHTLLVARWIASKNLDTKAIGVVKNIRSLRRRLRTTKVDQLFFLKHYRFDANDLNKYKKDFKGESGYDMEII